MAAANQRFLVPCLHDARTGLWPREHALAPGTVLYRFIDTTRAGPTIAADGPWWFEFEHFQSIKHFALRHEHSLGYAARLFAAILYEWSEVNAVVRARTTAPLVVWKGKGKQITVDENRPTSKIDTRDVNRTAKGLLTEHSPMSVSKMTPMQGPNEVYQIYVPGLGRPHNQFAAYLEFLSVQPIATG